MYKGFFLGNVAVFSLNSRCRSKALSEWLNPPMPGPKPRSPERQGSGRGPKQGRIAYVTFARSSHFRKFLWQS